MTLKQERRDNRETAEKAKARGIREAEADALIARLDARRIEGAALGLSERDSTDILRELREHVTQ